MEVFIAPIEKSLILRARGAELLILEQHVGVLKGLKKSKDFIDYFKASALINRPARKLFEAWLRKDASLFRRIYETIGEMDVEVITAGETEAKAAPEEPATEEPAKKKAKKKTSKANKKATKKKT